MPLTIKEVRTRSELKEFIDFPEQLYKDSPYYVPYLFFDQLDTLDPRRNPASAFCDSALYMAYRDGKPVGRVAAIVNRLANGQWNHREVRFGWYDFIDDVEVSKALMDKVVEFGEARGMDSVVGPLGFTDFDPEGLLVDGFDRVSTMPLIYNHPYYVDHIESMGFHKDAEWKEYRVTVPEVLPEKLVRVSKIVQERNNLRILQPTKSMMRKGQYGRKVMRLINECYKDLYNFTVMPDELADKYLGFYLSVLDMRFITLIENEKDELVAFGVTMPSIASALQKTRGKLFPFGWWHLAKRLFFRFDEGMELLLIGVRPDYRNQGVNSLVFLHTFEIAHKMKMKWAETNAILETNTVTANQFALFECEQVKRRRSYKKSLNTNS